MKIKLLVALFGLMPALVLAQVQRPSNDLTLPNSSIEPSIAGQMEAKRPPSTTGGQGMQISNANAQLVESSLESGRQTANQTLQAERQDISSVKGADAETQSSFTSAKAAIQIPTSSSATPKSPTPAPNNNVSPEDVCGSVGRRVSVSGCADLIPR